VVSDTGKGIAPDQIDRIFDPFHSTKLTGVGLGLAICHELVASFGGKITVTSELARGSRFTIELPVGRGIRATSSVPHVTELDDRSRGGRVLVIDDEIGIREALARMLGKHFDVTAVASADAAQALLRVDPDFDVVFCDLMMPGTTGIALAQWLATELPEVESRVVFMTGGAFTPEANEFLAKTTHAILEKPFLTEDLIRLARQTISRRAS
jgi:CheY-like chemotaxis protein